MPLVSYHPENLNSWPLSQWLSRMRFTARFIHITFAEAAFDMRSRIHNASVKVVFCAGGALYRRSSVPTTPGFAFSTDIVL